MTNDAISRSMTLENIYEMDISDCTDVEDIIDKAYGMIADAPALDVALVVHNRNTSTISVDDVDEWRGRIILDEGDKSKRCAVYYLDSDDDAPVVYCKDCSHARPLNLRELMVFDSGCFVCTSQYGAGSSYPEYEMTGKVVFPKSFCSYGHRRTNGR